MVTSHGDFFWYELMTTDVEGAKAFYGPLLGWEFHAYPAPGMDYQIFTHGEDAIGGLMGLTKEMCEHGARPTWAGYIYVDGVDSSAAEIERAGGSILKPAFDVPEVGRIAFVADPTGAPFYIMKPYGPDGESNAFARHAPMDGHCAWNELVTSNPGVADSFYRDLFGWERADILDLGEMGPYQMYRTHGYVLGAMIGNSPEMPVSMWNYYFRVPDLNEAISKITSSGGKLLMDPMDIPGGEFVVSGIDPQGALFSLIGKKVS